MKKLLYFTSDFKIGLSALLTDQLSSIVDAGVDVLAVAGDGEQEEGLSQRLSLKGITLTRIPGLDRHENFLHLVDCIYRLVREHGIDIIHVQNNWQLAIAGAVKFRLRGKPEIAYTLHGFRHNSPVKSRIAQAVIGSALFVAADHVICMTDYLKSKFSLLSHKIRIIPLGINGEFFSDPFLPPRTDGLHLIFPAQFRPGKNQDVIIRAFADYVHRSADHTSTLTLPGSGPLLESMRDLAEERGVSSQVIFPGLLTKTEIKNSYLASNIGIVASNSETFGQSIVEPYVLGRCVISTPVGIAPEIIEDGVGGYLFDSAEKLTGIFLKLASEPTLITTAGEANFANREKFSWAAVTAAYIRALQLL